MVEDGLRRAGRGDGPCVPGVVEGEVDRNVDVDSLVETLVAEIEILE